ncbi:MAG: hypothetical protein AMXMBFR20_22980 [Planctomycetia bacterium]
MKLCRLILIVAVCLTARSTLSAAEPLIEPFLKDGKLAAAQDAVEKAIKEKPDDQELRFQQGTVQFLRAVETLAQSLWRHGFLATNDLAMFVRLPLPPNDAPKDIDYDVLRKIMRTWAEDLARAEASLAGVTDEKVRMPLHFGLIRLDLNGDGTADETETLWRVFSGDGPGSAMEEEAKKFVINFDLGDAYWLRGYCHLLMALDDFALAHDFHDLFETVGHLFFPKTKSPYRFAGHRAPNQNQSFFGDMEQITDIIAFIHLINFPVVEPDRLRSSLKHLEQVIALSSKTWDAIEAEKDNNHEWLPNPGQVSVISEARVSKNMIAAWRVFLREAESILAGKTLLPFWRTGDDRGLNLRRIFTEPRRFDLVLWVQGSAAAPYLEEGAITDKRTWDGLMNIFEGRLLEYAIWFN